MVTWEVVTERVQAERDSVEAAADSAAVNNVLTRLTGTSTVDEAVQTALDTVRNDFGWAYGSFWKVDESDRELKFALESGDAGEEFRAVTLAASFAEGVGLSGRAWKTRDLYFTQDIGEMTDCVRAPVAQKVGVKSGVCFPIIVAGEVVGTMDFFATETLHPSEQRLDALRNVGRLVSQAIERVQKEAANRESAADTAAVNNVLASLTSATTVDEAVRTALDTVRNDFAWAYGSFWKVDESDRKLKFVLESGDAGEEFRKVTLAASFAEGVGLSGRAWKTRDLYFTQDIGEMTDCVRAPVAQKVGVKSGVCFPIIVAGEVIGTMDFFATETLHPSEQRLDALRNVGRLVSQAITRVQKEAADREAAADTSAVNNVLSSLSSATSVDEAVQLALDTVRNDFGWAYGSFWKIDPADEKLKFVQESGDAGPEFRKVTLEASFAKGVGLSGRTWASADLYFTQDIGEMTDCVRAPVAQAVGVKSGVCFPITVAGEVVGTMDFFATETLHPSEQRLDALRNVGRLVSQAVQRLEKENADREAAADLARKVDLVLGVVRSAAEGDLTREIPVAGDDAIGQLAAGLGSLLETLRGSMTNIGSTADTLAVASEQLTILAQGMGDGATVTSDRAASASGASVQVSASIQTVATAAEEMTASIREIAKNATEAATVATGAVSVASSAQGTVASLGESSAEIGQVIKVITSIAQQTNLLALNATIEAARAGDAGKGFAVVANEVKELAKETARATEDIGQKIEAIQADTQGAVSAIAEISEVIGRINDIQTTIASAVEEQTATTNEIARSVTEAAAGANGIAEDVTQVASAAEDTRQGAQNTLQSATDLSGMASELKGLVEKFTV
ncbi:GAF domain-containing protein [Nocardioides marmorisolisilvae]|uniref:GAF domain-containing protein n=2 Tax=Nocardioides marmorisolisilvae TaxID=1542737 RepID=A0A3N0DXD9_9ACTN|nr:GAF domain-containing protein [Nocardioides marmorisolisilvae]